MGTKKKSPVSKKSGASVKANPRKETVLVIRDENSLKPYIDLAKKHGGAFNLIDSSEVEDALMIGIIEKGLESGKGSLARVKKVLKGES